LSPEPRPAILIGSFNNLLDYRFGLAADLHAKFFDLLGQHSMIVMSGYSWNDIGINSWLSDWFDSSSGRRLVPLHHEPQDKKVIGVTGNFQLRCRRWVESGRIVSIQKWISEPPPGAFCGS